jgi:hypothetical protein
MIQFKDPSMALNAWEPNNTDYTVPGFHYQFSNTWAVKKSDTPEKIAGWVATVAAGAPGGRLNALVLNCHGFYSTGRNTPQAFKKEGSGGFGLYLGGSGIFQKDLSRFAIWGQNKAIEEIHITSCGIGKMTNLGGAGDGDRYCWTLAQVSGATVYGAIYEQFVEVNSLPFNAIDDYEGIVKRYYPDDRSPEVWRVFPTRGSNN